MRTLLILVVVLAIGLVAADRVGAAVAQNDIARKIAGQYQLPHQPHVTVEGVPFLTQAVRGRYRDIDVNVGEWSSQDIVVHDLTVGLSNVSAPASDVLHNRTANVVAETATAKALVPYDTVRHFAPRDVDSISYGPDGLHVAGTFTVEGIAVPATIVVTVAPANGGIAVTPVSVTATVGPTIPVEFLKQLLAFVVPLQNLPLGTRISKIQPGRDGLEVTAVANDVHFSDLPSAGG